MNQIIKAKALNKTPVDVSVDIDLINQHSLKELTPEEVFAFSVILCDNDIDRDFEKFSDSCLEGLAPLFVGKTGIFNHSRSAKDQIARIYHAVVENGEGKNADGSQKKQLRASAYIPRTDATDEIIQLIESGILKEVSVGVMVKRTVCSICGESIYGYKCDHMKGKTYDGQLCFRILDEPTDAYEFSFVAVPAQRGAGVTKGYGSDDFVFEWDEFIKSWEGTELSSEMVEKAIVDLKHFLISAEEKAKRQEILAENKKI